MMITIKRLLAFLALGCILSTACKVPHTTQLAQITTPQTYTDSSGTDSVSLGDLPPQRFFSDPYLINLIDSVLLNNLDLKRAVQRIQIAQSRYNIAGAALLPQVEGQAIAGFDKYGNYTQNGVGNFDTDLSPNINNKQRIPYPVTPDYFVGARANWEVDLWGKLRNLKKAAFARFLASQKGVQLIKTSLVAETASRYYRLLALDNRLRVIRDNVQLQDSALEIVKIQKQAGRANELAVQQFTAQLLNTKALEGIALQNITETENELNYLLGRYPQGIRRDTFLLTKPLPPIVGAGVPPQLLQRRPDIRQAELELEASRAEVAAARAAFYPSLNLSAYTGFNSFKLPLITSIGSLTYGVLGSLTAPIFYQGRIRRAYKIADAVKLDAYYNYQQTIQNGVREVVNSLSNIQNTQNVFAFKRDEVTTLDSAVSTSNLLFKTGYASYLEVITAQKNVVAAQLELVDTKERLFYSVIELYRSLGGGWK